MVPFFVLTRWVWRAATVCCAPACLPPSPVIPAPKPNLTNQPHQNHQQTKQAFVQGAAKTALGLAGGAAAGVGPMDNASLLAAKVINELDI